MLARQARVLGWNAGAVGAVAARAGSNVALLDAAAVDALAHGHQVLVLGKAVLGLLRVQPGGDVLHVRLAEHAGKALHHGVDRKSTRLNSSHLVISYAVFCLKKKKARANSLSGSAVPCSAPRQGLLLFVQTPATARPTTLCVSPHPIHSATARSNAHSDEPTS